MALAAVVSGDVDQAAEYGLAIPAQAFTRHQLTVDLIHRDLDRDVVDR
ncbi:hypothetical protein [Streptomyces sp. WAC01280]|nr:hypothetical protein [Streptomyces sp. WAC01280]